MCRSVCICAEFIELCGELNRKHLLQVVVRLGAAVYPAGTGVLLCVVWGTFTQSSVKKAQGQSQASMYMNAC